MQQNVIIICRTLGRPSSRRTPCSGNAAARALRCLSRRTPCICDAAARARICLSRHTPCIGYAAARARRWMRRRTPCICCTLPPVLADACAAALFALATLSPYNTVRARVISATCAQVRRLGNGYCKFRTLLSVVCSVTVLRGCVSVSRIVL